MPSSEWHLNQRRRRLDALCAGGRPTVRRTPPLHGTEVTIYRGWGFEPVSLVVEADWHEGCCVTFDCPGEPAGWDFGHAWHRRRGTWRIVRMTDEDWAQVERELGNGAHNPY